MTRKLIPICAIVLVLGAIYGTYTWQMKKKIAQFAGMKPTPTAVTVEPARSISWQPTARSSGQLVASLGVTIKSQSQGQVTAINMVPGQWVPRDYLLVTLEHADLAAQLASAKAQLQQAEAEYASYQQLAAEQNVSQQLLRQKRASLASARSAVVSANIAVQHKLIRTPFACHLGLSRLHVGQLMTSGQAVVSCQDIRTLKLYYSIPQQYLPSVVMHQKLDVTVDAYPGQVFSGQLNGVDTKVEEDTRGIALEAVVKNVKKQLLPGMLVSVAMPLGTPRHVVVVPHTALHASLYGDSVFVLDDSQPKASKVKEVRVKVGEAVHEDVIILDGITAGQKVVALGQANLRNGAQVNVVSAAKFNGVKP